MPRCKKGKKLGVNCRSKRSNSVSFPENHQLLCQQISQILSNSGAPVSVQDDQNGLDGSSTELRLKQELEDPSVDCIYFCDVNSLESNFVPVQNETATCKIVKTEENESLFIKKEGLHFFQLV
jgi:hypothetical protein